MNNLEKLIAVGEAVYGKNWQSPISRSLDISDRTIRRFVSGNTNIPVNLSTRLISAMEQEMNKIQSAINIINADKMCGDDVTIEMIADIADRYEYSDEMAKQSAIDEMNNAVYQETFLSDLEAIAQKWSTE